MTIQEAWDIIETCLYPYHFQCMECAEGGCDWPDCDCPCHRVEDEAREDLPQAISEVRYSIQDTARLDFLERQNSRAEYTGRCIFRRSLRGRGWRLHETSLPEAAATVRQAIEQAMMEES